MSRLIPVAVVSLFSVLVAASLFILAYFGSFLYFFFAFYVKDEQDPMPFMLFCGGFLLYLLVSLFYAFIATRVVCASWYRVLYPESELDSFLDSPVQSPYNSDKED